MEAWYESSYWYYRSFGDFRGLIKDYLKASKEGILEETKVVPVGFFGFILCFLDALGIGAFATLTAVLRAFKWTEDRTLPGTLNVCTTLVGIAEAIMFITVIEVEPVTLLSMVISASIGAFLGASVVAKFDEKRFNMLWVRPWLLWRVSCWPDNFI